MGKKKKAEPKAVAAPTSMSPNQFALLRGLFGALLSLYGLFTLVRFLNPWCIAPALLGVAIALGVFRRSAALLMISAHVGAFVLGGFALSPLLILALLFLILAPNGEGFARFSKGKAGQEWTFPLTAPVIVFALSLLLHAVGVLPALVLQMGLSETPLASLDFVHNVGAESSVYFRAVILADIVVCLFFFIPKARPLAFCVLVLSHAAFYLSVSEGAVAILSVACALFMVDERWVPAKKFKGKTTVFFDGVCTLCNASVDFAIREDRLKQFQYSSLQGKLAQRRGIGSETPDSIVLAQGGRFLTKSDAALTIAEGLGGVWRVLSVSRVLPKGFRDGVYQWIAKNRYDLFGKESSCRMPTPEERALFLD